MYFPGWLNFLYCMAHFIKRVWTGHGKFFPGCRFTMTAGVVVATMRRIL